MAALKFAGATTSWVRVGRMAPGEGMLDSVPAMAREEICRRLENGIGQRLVGRADASFLVYSLTHWSAAIHISRKTSFATILSALACLCPSRRSVPGWAGLPLAPH